MSGLDTKVIFLETELKWIIMDLVILAALDERNQHKLSLLWN